MTPVSKFRRPDSAALLDKNNFPFLRGNQRHDLFDRRRIAFIEEFLLDLLQSQAEYVDPNRPAQRFLECAMKYGKGQAELDREELKFGDFPRRATDPPVAFV